MRAYHHERGDVKRTRILIPDSAHGTNPASTAMAGFTAVELPSDARRQCRSRGAAGAPATTPSPGIMLTNPNTLGLFEEHIGEVVRARPRLRRPGLWRRRQPERARRHRASGRPRLRCHALQSAQDLLQPRTAAAAPAPGRSACRARLDDVPARAAGRMRSGADDARYELDDAGQVDRPGVDLLRQFRHVSCAPTPISATMARHGLRANSQHAVLNANYLRVKLRDAFPVPFDRMNMHEFVCQATDRGNGRVARSISASACSTTAFIRRPTISR